MSKIVQADNINAGKYYLNGKPLNTGGDVPHTMLPVGSIIMWPTQDPPSNWLLCNGAPVPSSFPLYAIMPTRPDFRGRFPAMNGDPGASGSYIKTLKTATDNKNIDVSNLPSHKHDIEFTIKSTSNGSLTTTNGFVSMDGAGTNDAWNVGTGRYHDSGDKCPDGTLCRKLNTAVIQNTGEDQQYAPPYYSINFIIYAGAPTS